MGYYVKDIALFFFDFLQNILKKDLLWLNNFFAIYLSAFGVELVLHKQESLLLR